MVVDVTPDTFQREVIERSREVPVVVDFWAEWCGPCRMLGPVLEQLAAQDEGRWVLAKLDTQAWPELANEFRIQGIPAVKAFKDGQVVDEFVGALPPPAVRQWLDRLLPSLADLKAVEAAEARARGEREAAVALYDEALGLTPDHAESLLSLAELSPERARELLGRLPPRLDAAAAARKSRLLLALEAGADDEEDLVATLTVDPDALEPRWALAHALAARGEHDEALAHLFEIVKRDRSFRGDGARKAMLEIFDVVGARSELADRWRSRLAMELFK